MRTVSLVSRCLSEERPAIWTNRLTVNPCLENRSDFGLDFLRSTSSLNSPNGLCRPHTFFPLRRMFVNVIITCASVLVALHPLCSMCDAKQVQRSLVWDRARLESGQERANAYGSSCAYEQHQFERDRAKIEQTFRIIPKLGKSSTVSSGPTNTPKQAAWQRCSLHQTEAKGSRQQEGRKES